MWALAVILLVGLIALILVLVAIMGNYERKLNELRRERRQCCASATTTTTTTPATSLLNARLTVVAVDATGPEGNLTGSVQVVAWDIAKLNEFPNGGWLPSFSTINNQKVVGWRVPYSGTYWVSYNMNVVYSTNIINFGAMMIVNGHSLQRSFAPWLDNSQDLQVLKAPTFGKGFFVNMVAGEVVSLVMVIADGQPNVKIAQTTMSLQLQQGLSIDPRADLLPFPQSIFLFASTGSAEETEAANAPAVSAEFAACTGCAQRRFSLPSLAKIQR
jgi:hypothetical protein